MIYTGFLFITKKLNGTALRDGSKEDIQNILSHIYDFWPFMEEISIKIPMDGAWIVSRYYTSVISPRSYEYRPHKKTNLICILRFVLDHIILKVFRSFV